MFIHFRFVFLFQFLPVNFGTFFRLYKLEKTAVWLVGVRLKMPGFRVDLSVNSDYAKLDKKAVLLVGVWLKTPVSIFPVFRLRKNPNFPPRKTPRISHRLFHRTHFYYFRIVAQPLFYAVFAVRWLCAWIRPLDAHAPVVRFFFLHFQSASRTQ